MCEAGSIGEIFVAIKTDHWLPRGLTLAWFHQLPHE